MTAAVWARLGMRLEPVLSLVFPDACQLCRSARAGRRDGYVCAACQRGLKRVTDPRCERCGLPFPGEIDGPFVCGNCDAVDLHFSSARAAIRAEGPGLELIHRYKYQRALWMEPLLGRLLAEAAAPLFDTGRWDAIVPVPLHPVREREREFNQAVRLGRLLSRSTGVALEHRWVLRPRATPSQTRLSREARHRNVQGAFEALPRLRLDGRRCLVVDDVLTTGATTNAVAALLRRRGAAEVAVCTVARGV